MPGGAGGPSALQTSPPARRRKSVDTNPHAALAGLTCRASPANSSVAGAATLDSVRLRRNRSLLLCETQSSPLTCARGAYRAWARDKAGIPWKFPSQCKKKRRPKYGGIRPAPVRPGKKRTEPNAGKASGREKGKREILSSGFHLKLFNQPRSCQIDILLSNAQYNIDRNFFNSFDKKRSKFFVFLPDSPEKPLFHAVF